MIDSKPWHGLETLAMRSIMPAMGLTRPNHLASAVLWLSRVVHRGPLESRSATTTIRIQIELS